MNTAKQKHGAFECIFKPCSLDDFYKYKMSMGLYNGKNPLLNFEVAMTYKRPPGNPCSKEQRCGVFNSDRNRIEWRSLPKRKPPLSKHAFIEIVNTTEVQRRT